MAVITVCQQCGFEGSHGFNERWNGVIHFHHLGGDCKGFWRGRLGVYDNATDAFEHDVVPRLVHPEKELDRLWAKAVRTELAGNDRQARRLFAQWNEAAMNELP